MAPEIAWGRLTPENIQQDIQKALQMAERNLQAIEALPPEDIDYESVAAALDDATEVLDYAWSKIEHLVNVMDSPDLRKAYAETMPEVTSFYSNICLREALWKQVKTLAESPEIEKLDPIRKRHVEELVEDFLESGTNLPEEEKQRVREIDNRLAEITQKFSENVLDATNDWSCIVEDESMIEQIPEVVQQQAFENARTHAGATEDSPKWRFTLHAPSMIPFMKFAQDESLRKEMWEASNAVGSQVPWDNEPLVLEILKLRSDKAAILGHKHFADKVLKRRMVKQGTRARQFIQNVKQRAISPMHEEVKALEQFRADQLREDLQKLAPWDVAYWSEKMLKTLHDFDEEELRQYFSVDQVMSGLFDLVERVFGLKVVEKPTFCGSRTSDDALEVWHPQVSAYEVVDADTGEYLGLFYTDWYPRDSKRGGAWMDCLRSGKSNHAGKIIEPHIIVLCGNMTPGVGGKPALMTHDEVLTIFHEFGHLMHQICGAVPVDYLNGISVAWDFVELPSQILENWVWERESLDLFARHVDTGETIPEDLYQKMTENRNFQKGLFVMRQLSLGIMDLDMHIDYDPNDPELSLNDFVESSVKTYRPEWKVDSPPIYRKFGHLFSSAVGYAAGYYSYLWSEVLESDAFEAFKAEGILNGETGRRFRREILSVGNSLQPEEAFKNFKGQEPRLNAYLLKSGLIDAETSERESISFT